MKISSPEVQQFIFDHEHDDEKELILKHKEILGVPSFQIANQIAGRRKAREKLPTFYDTRGIVYPPSINLEQSSSEETGKFKSLLSKVFLKQRSHTCVDLTGGFGVDTFFFSQIFNRVIYVEPNSELLQIARHNHLLLGCRNIQYENSSTEKALTHLDKTDLVYIDPSRRANNKKVFTLSDCEPDTVALQDQFFEKSDHVMIKTSPLLDIHAGLNELRFAQSVHVVAVSNEVKEVLFMLKKNFSDEPLIAAVNLKSSGILSFGFHFSNERSAEVSFSDPGPFLYEPNAAILKSGAFKSIATAYNLKKISANTHLYTSESVSSKFPGRIFKINSFVKPDPKKIEEVFPDRKANIITRNYPLSVDELKKKTKLKDGGEKFLIGFSGQKEKFLCAAERIQ